MHPNCTDFIIQIGQIIRQYGTKGLYNLEQTRVRTVGRFENPVGGGPGQGGG